MPSQADISAAQHQGGGPHSGKRAVTFIAEELQAVPEPWVSALLQQATSECTGAAGSSALRVSWLFARGAPVRHGAPCCALTVACVLAVAYRRRMKNKKIPDGWELIEEVVEDFETQMKEAVNEEHEGRRKNELTWKIHRIHWEKNRFLYDLMYVRKVMSRELVRA